MKPIGLLHDSNHCFIRCDLRQYGVSCQNISLKFVPEQLLKFKGWDTAGDICASKWMNCATTMCGFSS